VWPAIRLFLLSFTNYNVMSKFGNWVGFKNYASMFSDKEYTNSLLVTIKMALIIVPVQTVLALLFAVAVNREGRIFKFFRTGFFIPSITSFVAVAILWKQLLNPSFGLVNSLLKSLGLPTSQFLSSIPDAFYSVIFVCIWKSWGYFMVIFISGLQDISQDIRDATKIDGANSLEELLFITIPMLKRTILLVVVVTTMDAIKLFVPAYTMTAGGPIGTTTTTVYYLWRKAFRLQEIGSASAMSMILFMLIAIIVIIQFRIGSGDNNE
jgi:multiple sugar transport system permease protein